MNSQFRKTGLGWIVLIVAAVVIAAPAVAQDPALQTGLVANWAFDETSGTTAYDTVSGANAELLNHMFGPGEFWTTGILGGGLDFVPASDGSYPSGALVGNPAALDLGTNTCTLSTWVNMDHLPSAGAGIECIYDSRTDDICMYLDKGNAELRFKVTTADDMNVAVGAARPGIPEALLTASTWHHVVGTYDGEFARVYCDGLLIDAVGPSLLSRTAYVRPAGTQIQTGQIAGMGYQPADPSVSGSVDQSFFSGSIDDMAIWNRALNANEVAYLYNSGAGRPVVSTNPTIAPPAPPAMPSPVVHLTFDGNTTNSGTGGATYDGTIVDGTLGLNSYVAGKSGQGLYLQNQGDDHKTNGDFVSVPYTLTTNSGAISFWCKPDFFFTYMGIFDNSGSAASPQEDWEMWLYEDGNLTWRAENPQYRNYFDLDLVGSPPDKWYYITAVWQSPVGDAGKASISLYVDGQFAAGGDGPTIAAGDTFYLGGGNDGNEYAVAVFDDLQIFDQALTSAQVKALYDSYSVQIPGDATGDGQVTDADSQRLAANWGAITQTPGYTWWEMGDFDGDEVVGPKDAAIMAANWGYGIPAPAAAVPEPSTLMLLLVLPLMLLLRRQR
ncbi:MAG: PEP-CTERM sorting domain-containing protein [Pirellulales bacterium]|nr:PEP-CTERM sorting domain-containing protein [Pirellulales bacterium]